MTVPRISAIELFRSSSAEAATFDMDGVLADTEKFHVQAWQKLLESHTGVAPPLALIRETFGQTNDVIIPLLWEKAGKGLAAADVPPLSEEKEGYYREFAAGRVRPTQGLERFLLWLERRRVPLAIGTSGPRENITFLLKEFGWERHFQVLVDRRRFAAGKPAPDCFLAAAGILGVPPRKTIVFEDSLHGLRAAWRGGFLPAAIATTLPESALRLQARWVFRDFRDIAC